MIFLQFVDDGAKLHNKNVERVYDAMIRKFVLGRVFKAMATLVEVEEETQSEWDYVESDNYMTSKKAWEAIRDYIPTGKVIWEPFFGDGRSGKHLKDLGFKV
eukprot:SAG11_NODE_9086_length_945_cov_1.997636_3_plen_101_part_01